MRERNVLRGDKKLAGNVSVARAPRKKPNSNNITTTTFSEKKASLADDERGKLEKKTTCKTGFGRRAAKKH